MEKEKYLYDDSMNAIPTYDKDEINTMVGVIDCEWATSGAVNRFVTSANDGNKIKLASSDSYVAGISVYQHGSIVTIQTLGIVNVEDDGTLKAGQKCMPNNEGKAVLSSNNLGYRVLGRVDATHISMIVAPNVDMIQRAKVRDGELQNEIDVNETNISANTSSINNITPKTFECALDATAYSSGSITIISELIKTNSVVLIGVIPWDSHDRWGIDYNYWIEANKQFDKAMFSPSAQWDGAAKIFVRGTQPTWNIPVQVTVIGG